MIFRGELHHCPTCRDFVPYIPAIRGACCSECGRLFTDEDERDYRRYSRWELPEREERESSTPAPRWLAGAGEVSPAS
jgi:hypothetical protein